MPILIYSHRVDVRGLIDVLRTVATEVQVVGPEDDWTELIAEGPRKGLLRRRARLVVRHDSKHYDGPNWRPHIHSMWSYFFRFPEVPWKAELLDVICGFRFCVSLADAEIDPERDERLPWVYAICRHLDGVLMTPVMLMDSDGRILISGYQEYDADARLPAIPPTIDHLDGLPYEPIDSDESCEPPTAERVARRALVLAAVAERGLMENEVADGDFAEQSRMELLGWLQALDLSSEIEPDEWEILQRPFGRLDAQSMTDSIWRIEGLVVLLWALGRFRLPRYDQLVEPRQIWDAVGIYEVETARQILANAKLRSLEELSEYRTHATMANWRFRNYRLHPGPVDFVAMSQECWIGNFDIQQFETRDNDVTLDGIPIAQADPSQISICESIANERHRASNWLIAWNSPSYCATDTST